MLKVSNENIRTKVLSSAPYSNILNTSETRPSDTSYRIKDARVKKEKQWGFFRVGSQTN